MLQHEETELLPFDPEIERTFRERRREVEKRKKNKIGDKPLLRDLWIPKDQSASTDVLQPAIQANYFELKPALITMVQHNQFSGSALESPHSHIRNFLEYCNTLKYNGVPPEAIRMQLFPFSLRDGAKMWYHALPEDKWEHLVQAFYERYSPPPQLRQPSSGIRSLVSFSLMERAFMMLGKDIKV